MKLVEDVVRMLVNGAFSTCRAEREAVQAAEQRISSTTSLTGGWFIPQVQRFVSDKLIGKLVPVLEPLLEV